MSSIFENAIAKIDRHFNMPIWSLSFNRYKFSENTKISKILHVYLKGENFI